MSISFVPKVFLGYDIEVKVDNARTHSAKVVDINLLSKSSNTACPYIHVEWTDGEIAHRLDFFDSQKVSKGLFAIAKELSLIDQDMLPKQINLHELRDLVSKHKAFEQNSNSKLEHLCKSYKVTVILCPKYHCELNPIEGL